MNRNLSVVIPSYNEAKTVAGVIDEVLRQPMVAEVIVVDDGSKDNTQEVLKRFKNNSNVKVFRNEPNRGKGFSVRRGIESASAEYLIIQDADLELQPTSYVDLFKKLEGTGADMVNGVRTFDADNITFISKLASKMIPFFILILFGKWIDDVVCGYKLMTTEKYRELGLESDRFEVETEMIVRAIRKKYKIVQQEVEFKPRNKAEGKHIRWTDGLKVLKLLVKLRFGKI